MKQYGTVSAFAVLVVLLLPGVAPHARAAEPTTSVTESSGATSLLGGGEHRFIRFGHDAAFGVLWTIVLVSIAVMYYIFARRYGVQQS